MNHGLCYICNFPMLEQPASVWMPENDREEAVHEGCKEFFLASRPNYHEARERWLQQKASVEDDNESESTS